MGKMRFFFFLLVVAFEVILHVNKYKPLSGLSESAELITCYQTYHQSTKVQKNIYISFPHDLFMPYFNAVEITRGLFSTD